MTARILLVGDSLAVGLSNPLSEIAQSHGTEVKADGRTGTTAHDWVRGGWLAQDVASFNPDLILISLGTNDAAGDLSAFGPNVTTLIDQATSKGGKLAWIGPPYFAPTLPNFPAGNVERMRQTLLDTLSPRGINLFRSDAGGAERDYARAADKLHMTPAGYADWAKAIASWADLEGAKEPAPPAAPKMSNGKKVAIGLTIAAVLAGGAYWLSEG